MGGILRNRGVFWALLFSALLIVGAYTLARGVSSPPVAQASTETALLQAIASRDSDSDGLPDWEEALYGTDSHVQDTFHLGMTDGQAVAKGLIVPKAIANIATATSSPTNIAAPDPSLPTPAEGTITNAFAKNFFTLYLSAVQASPDGNLSQSDMQNVANQALNQLAQSVTLAPDFKSAQNIKVEGSGPDALKSFAAAAEAVFLAHKANASKSEIVYLQALENGDTTAAAPIASIAQTYQETAAGLAILPVPSELAGVDLALVNAMSRMSEVTQDFTRANSDPLATILALQQYPRALQNLGNAFIQINSEYKKAGISLSTGEAGASFVNLIPNVAASQKATQKP